MLVKSIIGATFRYFLEILLDKYLNSLLRIKASNNLLSPPRQGGRAIKLAAIKCRLSLNLPPSRLARPKTANAIPLNKELLTV